MKKNIKIKKGLKAALSMVLCVVMLCSSFACVEPGMFNFDLSVKSKAADITLGDDSLSITQTRVVSDYETVYAEYAERYFGGNGVSEPTDFVIPGLSDTDDYTPQGMTYWKAKDWILISAYDANETDNSVIYALDGSSTEFVALFRVYNADGSVNKSHGGGIAASEYNFYYADSDSKISYVPLSEMDVEPGTVKDITLQGSIDCSKEMNTAKTSYCCYDEGVLWTGNFFYSSTNYSYYQPANDDYNSMLFGYKLIGNSSEEEWAYLSGKYQNLLNVTATSGTATKNKSTINWNAYKSGDYVDIRGSITEPTSEVGEFTHNFGSAYLEEGKEYNVSFYSTNTNIEIFLFAPSTASSTHASIAQGVTPVETEDGLYYYDFTFIAGLKNKSMNSTWPTTATTDGLYTGTYTVRFDQNNVSSAYDFAITDFMITEANENLIELTKPSGTVTKTNAEMTYSVATNANGSYTITGTAINNSGSTLRELAPTFATVQLTHGTTYKLEFDLTTSTMDGITDFYFLRDGGTGSYTNVRYTVGGSTKVTANIDGTYHYETTLIPGEPLVNANGSRQMDGNWDTVDDASGSYSFRFDQDDILDGETRAFTISNIKLTEADTSRLGYRGNNAGVVGNPTYCIAFSDDIDKIQYAMVDNGRIYISRSWDRNSGSTHIKQLAVGEIDLNAKGTIELDINGRTRYCQLVSLDANNFTTFGGGDDYTDMFYMGEALCVMEGYLYMFAESAAYTYRAKTSDNVCPEPIDVIWKIDQYAIMGELRETDNEKSLYYEQVTSIDQIKNTDNELLNTDEYIIFYESSQKDPVTQKNILYALDAFGGHDGIKLPKNNLTSEGELSENANGYSIGIVGHPITEYAIEDGKLYLTNPEEDDVENIRWKFSGTENGQYDLQSTSLYYSKYKSLYYNGLQNFMSTNSAAKIYLSLAGTDNKFYIQADGFYIWCNDGAQGYDEAINDYYLANGCNFTEQPGTFHADGLNTLETQNVMNDSVTDFAHGQFYIYKRILDPNAEKESSKVYTNSTAELQPDGTYTINMETYAISPTHYTLLDEQRPTDFIFVLDASGSMTNNVDAIGYHTELSNWSALQMYQACGDQNNDFFEDGKNYNTAHESNYYYKFPDDEYGKIHVAFNKKDSDYTRDIWLWAEHPISKRCYRLSKYGFLTHGDFSGSADWDQDSSYRITESAFLTNQANLGWENEADVMADVSADINRTDYHSSRNSKAKRASYEVMNYTYTDGYGDTRASYYKYGSCYRLEGMQQAVEGLTYKIAEEAGKTGLAHRIAVVTYGSDSNESYLNTGMYPNTGVSFVGYSSLGTDTYKNAFFDVDNFTSVRRIINNIVTNSGDPDTYSNYGYEMANNIVTNYSGGYLADGDRSACIIMITDGIPGQGANDSNKDTVANTAITAAYNAKQNGAYSFTVQMGDASGDWVSMTNYMEYLSSEYVDAKSLTDAGDRNDNEVVYYRSIPIDSTFNIDDIVDQMFANITANSRMALTQLDTESILRQTISDNFYAPTGEDGADVEFILTDAYYDGLGRIAFGTEENAESYGVSGSPATATDSEGNEYYDYLDVTGFDYKEHYISKEHGGKKLIVRITGVLPRKYSIADSTVELSHVNSPISDDSYTGIYQTEEMLNKNEAFKGFPNATFTINEYTYTLDFGLQMLDTDVNGTLKSVSADLSAQRDADGNISYKTVSENGLVEIQDGAQNLLYYSTPTNTTDSGYVLIQRDDGTYDWFEIEVVPASNVYYEESNITTTAADYIDWSETANSSTVYQDLSTKDDVYGYDSAYEGSTGFSNDSYYKAVVESTSTKTRMSDTATFTFTGTSFDLIGACGTNTGIQAIKVKDSSGKLLNSYIIDTYLSDESIMTTGDDGLLLHQVPILSYRTTTYDTYTVEVTAAYLSMAQALKHSATATASYSSGTAVAANGTEIETTSSTASDALVEELENMGLVDSDENVEVMWMDDNSIFNGGTGASQNSDSSVANNSALSGTANKYYSTSVTSLANYIDGFRIYNPMNGGYDDYIESEQNATYYNIVEELEMDSTQSNMAYIESSDLDFSFIFGTESNFNAYNEQGGPKGEIYLKANDAIAFTFTADHTDASAPDIMLGMRAVSGTATATTTVAGAQKKSTTLTSATEMYYPIATDVTLTSDAGVTVIVKNTGTGVLAVNNLKLVDGTLTSSGDATESSSATVVGGTSSVPTPVVPTVDASQDDSDAPEADVENDVNAPETEVEDSVEEEADIAFEITGVPAPIASFLEMLFKFLGQLVSSFGF